MATVQDRPAGTLETERLVLRPVGPEHAVDLHRLHTDPFVVDAIFDGDPPTANQTRGKVLDYVDQWHRHGFGYWMVYEKGSGSEQQHFVGRTGLKFLDRTHDVELAHCFFRASSGKGYAVEAARAALAFGFRRAGLERIVCVVRPGNARSLRVTEKLGFRYIEERWHYGKTMRFFELHRNAFMRPGHDRLPGGL